MTLPFPLYLEVNDRFVLRRRELAISQGHPGTPDSQVLVNLVLDDRVAPRRKEPSSDYVPSQASGPRWRAACRRACRGGWTSPRREGPGRRRRRLHGASDSTRPGSSPLSHMPCRFSLWISTGFPGPSKVTPPIPGCVHAVSPPLYPDRLVCLDALLLAVPQEVTKHNTRIRSQDTSALTNYLPH